MKSDETGYTRRERFYGDLTSPAAVQFNLGLCTNYPILTQFGYSGQIFVEVPNIEFHRNPSSGSRADI
jgi:hypothetical protein